MAYCRKNKQLAYCTTKAEQSDIICCYWVCRAECQKIPTRTCCNEEIHSVICATPKIHPTHRPQRACVRVLAVDFILWQHEQKWWRPYKPYDVNMHDVNMYDSQHKLKEVLEPVNCFLMMI